MEYLVIEIFLAIWIILVIVLLENLTSKYPAGFSRRQAEIKCTQAFFYFCLSLILCGLTYFSAWLVSWSSKFSISTLTNPDLTNQLADFLSLINLSVCASSITFIFTNEKRNFLNYQHFFGLLDILPNRSIEIIKTLPLSKQSVLAERMSWLIEKIEKNDPFELSFLFDKEELRLLIEIFSNTDIETLDKRLIPIYQEISKLKPNPKPFSIIL
jgi:hypothetical protein